MGSTHTATLTDKSGPTLTPLGVLLGPTQPRALESQVYCQATLRQGGTGQVSVVYHPCSLGLMAFATI